MKKIISIVLGSVLMLSSAVTPVFAYVKNQGSRVECDNDGVCDNRYEVTTVSSQSKDIVTAADDDNTVSAISRDAKSYGAQNGGNANFVDEDNDGICDNRTEDCPNGGQNRGNANFVDEDGDGICDNRTEDCPNGGQGRFRNNADCEKGKYGRRHCAGR